MNEGYPYTAISRRKQQKPARVTEEMANGMRKLGSNCSSVIVKASDVTIGSNDNFKVLFTHHSPFRLYCYC